MHTHTLNAIHFFSQFFCLLWTKWKRSKLFVQIRFPPCLAAKSPSKALIRQDVHCSILQHHCSTFWHQTPFAFTNKGFQTRPSLWELLLVWSGLVNDNHHNFQVDIAICPYIGKIYMKHPNIAFSVAKMLRTGREQDYQTNHFATTAIATLLHHFLVVCWSLVGWSVTDNSLAANCPYFPYTSFFWESSYFSCSFFIRTQNSGKRNCRDGGIAISQALVMQCDAIEHLCFTSQFQKQQQAVWYQGHDIGKFFIAPSLKWYSKERAPVVKSQ